MKRIIGLLLCLAAAFAVLGCASAKKEIIYSQAKAEKSGVYRELSEDDSLQSDGACLIIRFSIKTHTTDFYVLEPEDSAHGSPEYPVVVNIDGQGEIWPVKGSVENTPEYNEKGRRLAEGGKGMRYSVEKHLRLKPGRHHVYLGFPEDAVSKEASIELGPGETVNLEFAPVYNSHKRHGECFYNGISFFRISMRK